MVINGLPWLVALSIPFTFLASLTHSSWHPLLLRSHSTWRLYWWLVLVLRMHMTLSGLRTRTVAAKGYKTPGDARHTRALKSAATYRTPPGPRLGPSTTADRRMDGRMATRTHCKYDQDHKTLATDSRGVLFEKDAFGPRYKDALWRTR
ncbi:hypothetical protein B0H21DRAFT_50578 [Amylocystis lapponica]|nr:hypothetical protein B0H21DRAFT_50578 [Amylocystis lapponica]